MKASVTILVFRHSVYQRVARIALHKKNVEFRVEEVHPFDAEEAERLRDLHPFGRVPVLRTLNNLVAVTAWTVLGDILRQFRTPTRAHRLNVAFGVLLAAVALWILMR
jgi:hypothetical protein